MKKFLFFLAVAGWLISLTVHIAALNDIDTASIGPVWLLHIGIFIVFIPAVLALRKNEEYLELKRQARQKPFSNRNGFKSFSVMFKHTPVWMRAIVIGSFFYAFINFALFFSSDLSTPEKTETGYKLQNHGNFVRSINEREYRHYKANEVRGFSGHWILFYGVAAALLYPFGAGAEDDKLPYSGSGTMA